MSFRMGIASSAMGGIEGYKRIRAASLGISFEGGVIGGRGWNYAGHVMGVVCGLVSVWDEMNKLTESAEATKTGKSLSAHHALILGGFGIVSGIISIIMIGANTGIGLVVAPPAIRFHRQDAIETEGALNHWGGVRTQQPIRVGVGTFDYKQPSLTKRTGRSSRTVVLQYSLGGTIIAGASVGLLGLAVTGLTGASLTGLVGYLFFVVGLIISACVIALGFAATKLVSSATAIWLDRCYLGHNNGQVGRFEDTVHEQAALDLLTQGGSIDLTWENLSGLSSGPQGVLAEALAAYQGSYGKKIMIKARIPNLSKMQFGMQLESASELGSDRFFDDTFDKDGESLIVYGKDGVRSDAFEVSVYDISQSGDVYTIERTLYLSEGEATAGVKLNVIFQDTRARPLRYLDAFKLEFD